jgi:signal transduction histidine kinase
VVEVAAEIAVACEAQDLDEMLGNMLDNACKYGRRQVQLAAKEGQRKVSISIDDDGPGLTDEQSKDVMRAGFSWRMSRVEIDR